MLKTKSIFANLGQTRFVFLG